MSNTLLKNNNKTKSTRSTTTASSSSSPSARLTRSQLEHQNKLRALYHDDDDAELPNSDPAHSEEGNSSNSISAQQTKENVNRNHQILAESMTPVPLKEEEDDDPENEGGDHESSTNNNKDVLNKSSQSAVVATPSPKPPTDEDTPPSKEEIKARAERFANYPQTNIPEPGPNDCLFGRGGGTNHHVGNKRYRKLVEDNKGKYLTSKRLDKPLVAMQIINDWRGLDPPGRFLKQDDATKFWNDVGDKKAREKTSQALREKTPVKERAGGGMDPREERTARFEPGTSSPVGRHVKRSSLARDHSLGTEMVGANEISLEGFSWDDSDRPVVRNENASVSPSSGGGRAHPPPHHHHHGGPGGGHAPHYPSHYGEHYHQYPPHPEYGHYREGGEHHPEYGQSPPPYPYVREHSLSNNPLSDATTSHPAPPAFGEHPPSYYGHHYPPGYGPPPPPPGHHGPYHPPPYSSHSPSQQQQSHPYYEYPHQQQTQPPKQRSREHSLQMNPLKGASTTQPAPPAFNDDESHASYEYDSRPPPLPSPTYDSRGPPPPPPTYYGGYGAPSPTHSAWPAPPPPGGHPSPQFSYHPGSNPSAFGRYNSGEDRSNSLRSLGSSVDAYYDRRDSSVSAHSGSQSRSGSGSAAAAAPPTENPASAGSSQDYSKIAELIRDSSDKSSVDRDRSTSWDDSGAAKGGEYEDFIPRSRSMPYDESHTNEGGGAMPGGGGGGKNVGKPSLIRKLSGGAMARNTSASSATTPMNGIMRPNPVTAPNVHRPEPVKRDTSNQPETFETKRSIKRVVLSRDQSAVSRRLKEEQGLGFAGNVNYNSRPKLGARVSSRLTKAEMLDRKMSVELNKLGLDDRMHSISTMPALNRMTTEDVLTSLIDDNDLPDSPPPTPPPNPSPKPLSRVTTIDAIALDIANGKPASEWDDTLDLIEECTMVEGEMEIPGVPNNGSGVNADIAEKWLKGET